MLIEIRIGPGKRKIVLFISKIRNKCRIHSSKIHRVPHITLFGSFSLSKEKVKEVIDILESVGKKYSFLPYTIDGFKHIVGKKGKVIYFNIIPSEELKKFRKELAEKLLNVVTHTQPFDKDQNFLFHSTIAYKLSDYEFKKIWSFLSSEQPFLEKLENLILGREKKVVPSFYLPLNALRITFLNDRGKIICEYDFLQKRILSRKEALNRNIWGKTLRLFRIKKGMENCREKNKSIYLVSDLHLDHKNIIHYCARPFLYSNVEEMNRVLINNWNNTVNDNPVYFLGDLSFGKGSRGTHYWLKKLRGDIHFIKGCHDRNVEKSIDYEILRYKGYKFLLIHNPDKIPFVWDGWIIHGHKHNNDLKNYPFINGEKKTINVSVEVTNYKPVSLDYLISLDLHSIKRMDFIDSIPERKNTS